jgi:hypothetical protein
MTMRPLAQLLPFTGSDRLKTYAAYPVWADSTTKPIQFQPLPKKQAVRLYHRARDFDRKTRQPGRHGGRIGRTALQVLHALIFDFLNYGSGRLDPSYAAIARAANVCERTVADSLRRLRELGMLNWVRRCSETWQDGRFVLAQQTNAYAVLPCSQWQGYTPPPEPEPPQAGTWGDHPPLPSVVAQAAADQQQGDNPRGVLSTLASDPTDLVAAALARLGRSLFGGNS